MNEELLSLQMKRRCLVENSVLLKDNVDRLMERTEKEQKLIDVTKANMQL